MIVSIPFVVAEVAIGVVSLLMGRLRIPPLIGAGTAVDMTILLMGLGFAVLSAPTKSAVAYATNKQKSR